MEQKIKMPIQDLGTATRPKLGEIGQLQNRIASSIDKLLKTKLEIFAETVRVNMDELKKKNEDEIIISLEHMVQHIYKM